MITLKIVNKFNTNDLIIMQSLVFGFFFDSQILSLDNGERTIRLKTILNWRTVATYNIIDRFMMVLFSGDKNRNKNLSTSFRNIVIEFLLH